MIGYKVEGEYRGNDITYAWINCRVQKNKDGIEIELWNKFGETPLISTKIFVENREDYLNLLFNKKLVSTSKKYLKEFKLKPISKIS